MHGYIHTGSGWKVSRFKPADGIRCQRVPMHLRQELGKERHEENAADDGILSAFTNAARNYCNIGQRRAGS